MSCRAKWRHGCECKHGAISNCQLHPIVRRHRANLNATTFDHAANTLTCLLKATAHAVNDYLRCTTLSLVGVMSFGSAPRRKPGETFQRCPSSEMTVTVFLLYFVRVPVTDRPLASNVTHCPMLNFSIEPWARICSRNRSLSTTR